MTLRVNFFYCTLIGKELKQYDLFHSHLSRLSSKLYFEIENDQNKTKWNYLTEKRDLKRN